MRERRHSFTSFDIYRGHGWVNGSKKLKVALYPTGYNSTALKSYTPPKPIWNSSTRLNSMNNSVNHNGSIDLLPSAEETSTPIGANIKAFESPSTKRRNSNSNEDPDNIAGVKIYSIWNKKLCRDQSTAEVAWKRLRKLAYDGLHAFCERLAVLEELSVDDSIYICLDLELLLEKQAEIKDTLENLEDFETEFRQVSKAFQNIAQFLPLCPQRAAVKARMASIRKRYYVTMNLLLRKKEWFLLMIPLLQQYKELGSEVKNWLDATEARSELFIKNYNNHAVILENEEAIESIHEELFIQKDVYESFLESGEKMLDLNKNYILLDLSQDIDDVVNRWDALVSSIEKCVNRLEVAKKLAEKNKKNDTEKIELRIRSEAQNCSCHKPFQIIRIGEGKYTFGASKIVRLVRIHGTSIVVRVGGGWEFLYDFLLKSDPCRAKQVAENSSKGLPMLHLSGLSLTPMNKKEKNGFSLNVQRLSQTNWSPYRNRQDRSGSVDSAASSENIDNYDESSDSMSLSTSTGPSTPQPKTPRKNTPSRKHGLIRSSSIDQMPRDKSRIKKLSNPRRISLIERQTEYAEKRKVKSSTTADLY